MKSNQQLYKWIGKQIASFRQEKKLSQTDLAKLTDLSRGSIANIEKGRQQTPLHVLWNISEKLELTIDQLLPIQNEHISEKSTNELIQEVDKMEGLKKTDKEILSEFLKNL